jgi:signal transduction histidine kinase
MVEAKGAVRRSRRLSGARAAVATLGIACVALLIVSVPTAYVGQVSALGPNAAALARLGLTPEGYAATGLVLLSLLALICFLVGALLLWIAPGRGFATFSAAVLFLMGAAFPQTLEWLVASSPQWAPAAAILNVVSFAAFTAWLLTFPDGRFRQAWVAAVAVTVAASAVVQAVGITLGPAVDSLISVALFGALAVAFIARHRSPDSSEDRARLRWVLLAIVAAITSLAAATVLQAVFGVGPGTVADLAVQIGLVLAFTLIPLTIAAAVLRRGLWDARGSVARAATSGLVAIGAVAAYALLVVSLVLVEVDRWVASVVSVAIVIVVAHPAYRWLRRRVNRALYGDRDDPRAVLAELTRLLEAGREPSTVLGTATLGLARLLGAPHIAIESADGRHEAQVGVAEPGWPTHVQPIERHDAVVGRLIVGTRDRDAALSARDVQVITAVGAQVGELLHAIELDEQLRDSRRRVVASREEERRRLRNDLHDGLGPALGAIALALAAAENSYETNPSKARELVADARKQVRSTVTEVRRIVHGLRPPALDEVGLMEAVSAYARGLAGHPMTVTVTATRDLPPLPAAVEVAAYRICVEAVNNAARHAAATTCDVRLDVESGWLHVSVEDDGRGIAAATAVGVGVESMRERTAELRGTFELSAKAGGGTRVLAVLPLGEGDSDD